ncbi:hypothetical protein NM688_g8696 [Phlebia brevispora]|uniref:Uncharacterized protein n=1 Tax=Phlebia brevispora TaxID=194682 RepID=A0ACC1RRH1_9APHY|nr:hypothetical protein NM688_g8696 [Phlebia brevispora]
MGRLTLTGFYGTWQMCPYRESIVPIKASTLAHAVLVSSALQVGELRSFESRYRTAASTSRALPAEQLDCHL